jgi:excisionase family DNA binding protein
MFSSRRLTDFEPARSFDRYRNARSTPAIYVARQVPESAHAVDRVPHDMVNNQENSGTLTQDVALLNKVEAARRLGVCVRTLDNRIREGLVPFVKIGKATRFIPRDIEQFIASHRIGK